MLSLSTPISSEAFSHLPIAMLAGTVPVDKKNTLKAVRHGIGTPVLHRYSRKVFLNLPCRPKFSLPKVKNPDPEDQAQNINYKGGIVKELICYCFGYSVDDIHRDCLKNGKSTIMERIKMEKKFGNCRCATKNPKGK